MLKYFVSPLEPILRAVLERDGAIDITTAVMALGACSAPERGATAYRIVAADVLLCMTEAGCLVRSGSGDPRKPEDGGFVWRKAQ